MRTVLASATGHHSCGGSRRRSSRPNRAVDRMVVEPMVHRKEVAKFLVRIIAATFTAYSIVQPKVMLPDRSGGSQGKVLRLGSPGTGTTPGLPASII